jgi:hypothetical protein
MLEAGRMDFLRLRVIAAGRSGIRHQIPDF